MARIGHSEPVSVELCRGEYQSQWGLTDLYKDAEEKLRELILSGEDFLTHNACKKEIRYSTIVREDGAVHVYVNCEMDDLWDGDELIYDALWEACDVEAELPDEIIDSIRDAAIDAGWNMGETWTGAPIGDPLDDHTELHCTLPGNATYEQVLEALGHLEDQAEENNSKMFATLKDIVKEHYEWMTKEA